MLPRITQLYETARGTIIAKVYSTDEQKDDMVFIVALTNSTHSEDCGIEILDSLWIQV